MALQALIDIYHIELFINLQINKDINKISHINYGIYQNIQLKKINGNNSEQVNNSEQTKTIAEQSNNNSYNIEQSNNNTDQTMNICIGLTIKGEKCKRHATIGKYCKTHVLK